MAALTKRQRLNLVSVATYITKYFVWFTGFRDEMDQALFDFSTTMSMSKV